MIIAKLAGVFFIDRVQTRESERTPVYLPRDEIIQAAYSLTLNSMFLDTKEG